MFLGSEGPTFFQIRALFFGLGQKPKKISEKFQSTKKIFSCLAGFRSKLAQLGSTQLLNQTWHMTKIIFQKKTRLIAKNTKRFLGVF